MRSQTVPSKRTQTSLAWSFSSCLAWERVVRSSTERTAAKSRATRIISKFPVVLKSLQTRAELLAVNTTRYGYDRHARADRATSRGSSL